jgi:hypothetical protein
MYKTHEQKKYKSGKLYTPSCICINGESFHSKKIEHIDMDEFNKQSRLMTAKTICKNYNVSYPTALRLKKAVALTEPDNIEIMK